ncbi:MAG: sialidase family protein [Bacteroidota bacterium]|nr:sialidase family protein [Bacteroidota bacterium]
MRTLFFIVFVFTVPGFKAQFQNIHISSQLEPEEVTIAINPKNTKQIIAGANIASAYYSEDAGFTWKRNAILCDSFGVYGDPVVFWDTAQSAYFMHLSFPNPKINPGGTWVDRIVTNKSSDFGKSYPNCYAIGKNKKKVQDKHWACVDNKTNTIHISWTQFDVYGSKEPTDTSIIKYSNSKDGGKTWAEPKKISFYPGDCVDSDNTLEGATPCMGPNGEIYIAWAGSKGLSFTKSLDGGKTFLEKETIINPIKNGWDYNVDGVNRCNGLPFTACDLSNGEHKGRIYISWGDEKNGEKNKDVFIVYSDDKGETWTEPILVTYHPNHKEQFMPFMTIDQTTGYLYLLYYDRQNYSGETLTDVYMAVSKNGGLKFDYYKINQTSFKPYKDVFFGDYIGLSVVNNVIRPIWMQMDEKKNLSIYTAIINDTLLNNYNLTHSKKDLQFQKQIPFADKIKFEITSENKTNATIALYKPLDAGFEKIVFKNKKLKKGKNTLVINTKLLNIQKDNYVLFVYYNSTNQYSWIIKD